MILYNLIHNDVACVDHLVYSVILASFTLGSISKTPEGIEKTGTTQLMRQLLCRFAWWRRETNPTQQSHVEFFCATIESLDARMFSPQLEDTKNKSSVDHGRSSSFCIFQFQGKSFCAMPLFFPLYRCWGHTSKVTPAQKIVQRTQGLLRPRGPSLGECGDLASLRKLYENCKEPLKRNLFQRGNTFSISRFEWEWCYSML